MYLNKELGLYLHFPWCIKKCPYCDFNSYSIRSWSVEHYLTSTEQEIDYWATRIEKSTFKSIYFGGGTPTLLKPKLINLILEKLCKYFNFNQNIEISIEGNPATFTRSELQTYHNLGINRFSIGIQTFNEEKLKILKRLNTVSSGKAAIEKVQSIFNNFNIDLMYGLPNQTVSEALEDLKQALQFHPAHLSWYQLTLKNNSSLTGILPTEETIEQIEQEGKQFLTLNNMKQYEISAYSKKGKECKHNLNYWQYGDYLALGAGSHGKLTKLDGIWRYSYFKNPQKIGYRSKKLKKKEIILEFFLNRFRLTKPIPIQEFIDQTRLSFKDIQSKLMKAEENGFINLNKKRISLTQLGKNYLDDLLLLFI